MVGGWQAGMAQGKDFIFLVKDIQSYLSTTDVLKDYVELEVCSQEIRVAGAENSQEVQCKTP